MYPYPGYPYPGPHSRPVHPAPRRVPAAYPVAVATPAYHPLTYPQPLPYDIHERPYAHTNGVYSHEPQLPVHNDVPIIHEDRISSRSRNDLRSTIPEGYVMIPATTFQSLMNGNRNVPINEPVSVQYSGQPVSVTTSNSATRPGSPRYVYK